jgi:hypothetical protein
MTVSTATTTSSSSITIALQHQCVSLGALHCRPTGLERRPACKSGVARRWASRRWTASGSREFGRRRGIRAAGGADRRSKPDRFGSVVIRCAQRAQRAQRVGGSAGSVWGCGKTQADGLTVSFSQSGMQVVALICAPLPLIPPAVPAASSSSAASSSAASGATASTSSGASATNGNSDGASSASTAPGSSSSAATSSSAAPDAALASGASSAPPASSASSPGKTAATQAASRTRL